MKIKVWSGSDYSAVNIPQGIMGKLRFCKKKKSLYTVKPVLRGHFLDKEKVAF